MKISEIDGTGRYRDLITAIYTELGYEIEIIFVPAERGLVNVNYGVYDADLVRVCGMVSEYPNLMETTEPIADVYLQVWAKIDSEIIITSPEDLKKCETGLVIGIKSAENLAEDLKIPTIKRVVTMDRLHIMLIENRLDVALVLSTSITPAFSKGLYAVAPELVPIRGVHILNKKHADLAPKFDAILKAMKADGRYQELISGK